MVPWRWILERPIWCQTVSSSSTTFRVGHTIFKWTRNLRVHHARPVGLGRKNSHSIFDLTISWHFDEMISLIFHRPVGDIALTFQQSSARGTCNYLVCWFYVGFRVLRHLNIKEFAVRESLIFNFSITHYVCYVWLSAWMNRFQWNFQPVWQIELSSWWRAAACAKVKTRSAMRHTYLAEYNSLDLMVRFCSNQIRRVVYNRCDDHEVLKHTLCHAIGRVFFLKIPTSKLQGDASNRVGICTVWFCGLDLDYQLVTKKVEALGKVQCHSPFPRMYLMVQFNLMGQSLLQDSDMYHQWWFTVDCSVDQMHHSMLDNLSEKRSQSIPYTDSKSPENGCWSRNE